MQRLATWAPRGPTTWPRAWLTCTSSCVSPSPLTLVSEQTMVYQAARAAGWPHGFVWLFGIDLFLLLPRLGAVIGWPH